MLCLVFVVLWSMGWVGSKYAIGLTGPFTFLTWRYIAVVALLGLLVIATNKWKKISLKETLLHLNVGFLVHGVFLGASLGAMQLGVSAGMTAFVTAMQPILTAVLAHKFTDEAPTRRQWCGMLLGLLAVAVVIGGQITLGGNVAAYILLIFSLSAVSVGTLLDRAATLKSRRLRQRKRPLLQIMLLHSFAGLILFSVLGYSLEGLVVVWSKTLIMTMAFMVIVVSIGSYAALFLLLRHVSVIKVSALIYLTPPTTMIMAWMFFDETLSVIQWAGLSVAAIAVWIIYQDDVQKGIGAGSTELSKKGTAIRKLSKNSLNIGAKHKLHADK